MSRFPSALLPQVSRHSCPSCGGETAVPIHATVTRQFFRCLRCATTWFVTVDCMDWCRARRAAPFASLCGGACDPDSSGVHSFVPSPTPRPRDHRCRRRLHAAPLSTQRGM